MPREAPTDASAPGGLLRFVEVTIGAGGLPSCVRCGPVGRFAPRPDAEVIADALGVIEVWDRALCGPGPNLAFVGGEPFLHPGLPGVVFASAEAGASRLRLRTSGEALSTPENATGVVHAGVRNVEIVLLGDAAAHDELSARPEGFAASSAGTDALADSARAQGVVVALTGLVPVCRHNLAFAPAAVSALSRMGASEVVLDVSSDALAAVGAGAWIASACDTGIVNGTWVSVRAPVAVAGVPAIHRVVTAESSSPKLGGDAR